MYYVRLCIKLMYSVTIAPFFQLFRCAETGRKAVNIWFGQAKVGQFRLRVCLSNVGRFEVAMDAKCSKAALISTKNV